MEVTHVLLQVHTLHAHTINSNLKKEKKIETPTMAVKEGGEFCRKRNKAVFGKIGKFCCVHVAML